MSVFSFLQHEPLAPEWQYQCSGILWRMMFSGQRHLIGEDRNAEKKTVSFFCLDEKTGTPLWQNKSFEENWWISIEDVNEDNVYFHSFFKPDMPQHVGIITCKTKTGEEIWRNMDYTFVLAMKRDVYTVQDNMGEPHYYSFNPETGLLQNDLGTDPEVLIRLRQSVDINARFKDFLYPEPFDATHPDYAGMPEKIFSQFRLQDVRGTIDSLTYGKFTIVSWHEVTGYSESMQEILRQQIKVIDRESSRTLYADTLTKQAIAPGIDSFFIKDGLLFFIKDLSVLSAIHLPLD